MHLREVLSISILSFTKERRASPGRPSYLPAASASFGGSSGGESQAITMLVREGVDE